MKIIENKKKKQAEIQKLSIPALEKLAKPEDFI